MKTKLQEVKTSGDNKLLKHEQTIVNLKKNNAELIEENKKVKREFSEIMAEKIKLQELVNADQDLVRASGVDDSMDFRLTKTGNLSGIPLESQQSIPEQFAVMTPEMDSQKQKIYQTKRNQKGKLGASQKVGNADLMIEEEEDEEYITSEILPSGVEEDYTVTETENEATKNQMFSEPDSSADEREGKRIDAHLEKMEQF